MQDLKHNYEIESAGYRLGKKNMVIGKDFHHVLLRLPTPIFNALQQMAEKHENSLNREVTLMIHHAITTANQGDMPNNRQ